MVWWELVTFYAVEILRRQRVLVVDVGVGQGVRRGRAQGQAKPKSVRSSPPTGGYVD